MLEKINSIKDLKELSIKEKEILAEDIREYILDVVSKNGGHLASNLGVVDLTIALESVFDPEVDKIIWDVGHQVYTHKILNGRKEEFKNIRKFNCIAGFPKTKESETDCFNTGHSSTSLSAAMGMAKARDFQNKKHSVVAVIGDGALTGGMALEALNHIGCTKTNVIVILNDNEMSISKNISGLNMFLSKLRARKPYTMYFEDIGYKYLGPINGHDIEKLEDVFKKAKELDGPVLIHTITKKGKGYEFAENKPDRYHATAPFDIKTGNPLKEKSKDYSKCFGDKLIDLASKNDRIVAITAAMKDGTGLGEFATKYPDRFFDVGIAEQHAVTFAAGLAKEGMIPFVPIYSSFYQRAYDQVIHDVCLQDLHVIMCVDRAGIVGADGETHHGIFDLSYFKLIPNIVIMAPKDFKELEKMMEFAIKIKKPVVIRYPRGGEGEGKEKINKSYPISFKRSEILTFGNDVTILAIGNQVSKALSICKKLKANGINAEVINARFLKPFDDYTILKSIKKTKFIVTIEDNTLIGGLGSKIKELIIEKKLKDITVKCFGYPDVFVEHGSVSELEEIYHLDEKTIMNYIKSTIGNKR